MAPPGSPLRAAAPLEVALGTYHRTGVVDAINLHLRSDGSFELDLYGCDYSSRSGGRWARTAQGIQLLPSTGQVELDWDRHGFADSVAVVQLSMASPVELVASVDGRREIWLAGRICAVCGPPGPPPSQLVPCEERR